MSSFSLAAGMAWKSGIAAELIDQTQTSLGNGMYRSKISLATADMLAWTVAAVVLSFIFERILILLLKLILNAATGTGTQRRKSS
jgi:NitT/TauT family transport system permease protein